jgi:hypothetical protein
MRGTSRWNPLTGLTRSWGHFVRRSRSTQLRTLALVGAIVVGLVVWVAAAPPSSSTAAASNGGTSGTPTPGSGPTPVSKASTSSRGVTQHTINVVLPVVSLNSLAGKEGFAQDAEFGEQTKAILLFVKQINRSGGINGRKINPIIVNFDPTDESAMRALCKNWTEGSPAAFAVLDGVGDWSGDNELCVTQEGHTPMIAQWTTVTNWARSGHGAPGGGQLGAERAVAGGEDGGRDRRRPRLGPAGPQAISASGPEQGRCHPGGQDHCLGSQ